MTSAVIRAHAMNFVSEASQNRGIARSKKWG